jgi:hypothetical protein
MHSGQPGKEHPLSDAMEFATCSAHELSDDIQEHIKRANPTENVEVGGNLISAKETA